MPASCTDSACSPRYAGTPVASLSTAAPTGTTLLFFGLIRHYKGLENWPSWPALRRWSEEGEVSVTTHRGLHLFPFMLQFTQPLLRKLDAMGHAIGPLYVNQCIAGTKRG